MGLYCVTRCILVYILNENMIAANRAHSCMMQIICTNT